MNSKDINILDASDLIVILNAFQNVDSILIREKHTYQIHISEFKHNCTLAVTIKEGFINTVKLINGYND